MISRKSARKISEAYVSEFSSYSRSGYGNSIYKIKTSSLYDFLFDNDYSAWFCNKVKKLSSSSSTTRSLKEFFMQIHTGETLASGTEGWSWQQREKLGQRYLQNIAEDILNKLILKQENGISDVNKIQRSIDELLRQLELDGYVYRDLKLLAPQDDILDLENEVNLLEVLFARLNLANKQTAFHHLKLSEEHYLEGRWDNAIGDVRKFLESTLQEIAAAYSQRIKSANLPENIYTRPVKVRVYLENENLLEEKEGKALAEVYGLLSNTGSHPYMAQNDQARLMRNLAYTFSQFALLRYEGALAKANSA